MSNTAAYVLLYSLILVPLFLIFTLASALVSAPTCLK